MWCGLSALPSVVLLLGLITAACALVDQVPLRHVPSFKSRAAGSSGVAGKSSLLGVANSSGGLLTQAQQTPLFPKNLFETVYVKRSLRKSISPQGVSGKHAKPHDPQFKGGMIFTHYHKTGTKLTNSLMLELAIWQDLDVCDYFVPQMDLQPPVTYRHGQSLRPHWDEPFTVESKTLARVDSITSRWPMPANARMVHWYRRPSSLIISAYRYHMSADSLEKWESITGMCHMCDEDAHEAIFQLCNYNCSYFDLLNRVDAKTGLAIEVMNERLTIFNMVSNFKRWVNDPSVLHLTMAHLTADFQGTIKCLLRFYGLPDDDEMFLASLQDLDVSAHSIGEKRHVTSGKYDNAELHRWLNNHPTWGRSFAELALVEDAVFTRQQKLYGCPMPSSSARQRPYSFASFVLSLVLSWALVH